MYTWNSKKKKKKTVWLEQRQEKAKCLEMKSERKAGTSSHRAFFTWERGQD
jgi:hypothetical protein